MFDETITATIFDSDVLYETVDGTVERSDWFVKAIEKEREAISELDDEERETELDSRLDTDLTTVFEGDETHVLPELLALVDAVGSIGSRPLLWSAMMLDQYRPSLPPRDGSPEYFLPVHGDRLSTLLRLSSSAIVYVWRHDCRPCELVRSDLETMIDPTAIDRPLFSIYGPDSSTMLQREYDVYGGPTVLFCEGDRVDMRIQGGQHPKVLHRAFRMEAESMVRTYEEFLELVDSTVKERTDEAV